MTTLTAPQMRRIDGEGFFEGFSCGAATSVALALTLSPDPITKIAVASAWLTVIGTCGVAVT